MRAMSILNLLTIGADPWKEYKYGTPIKIVETFIDLEDHYGVAIEIMKNYGPKGN